MKKGVVKVSLKPARIYKIRVAFLINVVDSSNKTDISVLLLIISEVNCILMTDDRC